MATTRERIDSRGRNLLQLLEETQSDMANLMNPSSRNQNTYNGPNPDDPVNISWPKTVSVMGDDVAQSSQYFLREYNLEGVPTGSIGSGDGVMTQAQHDDGPFGSAANVVWRKNEGKQHDQPFVDNNTGYAANRSTFMNRSQRKSLATLYWEMRGAFVDNDNKGYFNAQGQDGQDKTYTNRYGHEEQQTYDNTFLTAIEGDIYDPPTSADINASINNNFNLGQIYGPDLNVINALIEKGKNIARDFFGDLIANAIQNENPFLAAWWRSMSGITTGGADRVSQLYRPGFSRPPIPGSRGRWSQLPLTEMLEQNLLLPPPDGSYPIPGSTNGVGERLESTYNELYVQNRAAGGTVDPRYTNGLIAGTGINDLQEPIRDLAGNADVRGGKVKVPFTFAEDDAVYLTHSKKVAGWVSNTPNTNSNPDAMEPAVIDVSRETAPSDVNREATYIANAREAIDVGDGQYFPFTFSTVNKKNKRMQICSLQATIQSLGESYTPTWQSKHFFGRSEQVHTYTFTDRTIDLSFVIFADSMRQLQNVYERVLWLSQQCYPDYSNKDRIATGPLVALRVGDLFQHKAGFIRSLSYDWNFLGAGGKWELTRGVRMPQACNVSMSYQVIHERVPDRDYNFYGGPMGGVGAGMQIQRDAEYTQNNDFDNEGHPFDNGRYIPPGVIFNGESADGPNYGEREYLQFVDSKNEAEFDPEMINQLQDEGRDSETGMPSVYT